MHWTDFYAEPDLADGFGSTTNRPNPHYGLDFAQPGGTSIPAYVGGTVTVNEWSSVLGWVLEVESPSGRFVGYRHMLEQSPFTVGSRVAAGQALGFVGDTGSASRGNHLCTTNSTRARGVFGTAYCVDPWPHIRATLQLSTPAGGTGTPIAPAEGDEDMARIVTVGSNQHLVGATRSTKIDGPSDATTLRKYLAGADTLTEGELNTVNEYLWRLSPIHDGVPDKDGWASVGQRLVNIEAEVAK